MSLEVEVSESKEYKKFAKLSSESEAREFGNKTNEELNELIAKNTMHKAHVTQQTKANPQYQSACNVKKDFDDALRDKLKPTNAALDLAVVVLKSRGVK